jgi:hypothetical protein
VKAEFDTLEQRGQVFSTGDFRQTHSSTSRQ